jgi:hypothetical protein
MVQKQQRAARGTGMVVKAWTQAIDEIPNNQAQVMLGAMSKMFTLLEERYLPNLLKDAQQSQTTTRSFPSKQTPQKAGTKARGIRGAGPSSKKSKPATKTASAGRGRGRGRRGSQQTTPAQAGQEGTGDGSNSGLH